MTTRPTTPVFHATVDESARAEDSTRADSTLASWIETTLRARLQPTELIVTDESEKHRGHAGWRDGQATHFRLDIVSEAFVGKSRVDRHRLVNDVLRDAFARGLHALADRARAPGEAG